MWCGALLIAVRCDYAILRAVLVQFSEHPYLDLCKIVSLFIYLFFLRNKERGATCCVIKVVGLKNKFAKNFKIEIKIIIFVTIIHLSCDRL